MPDQSPFKPRKAPTQARSRATFDAILEAAAQLLDQLGYARTTTNRIAERAGVSIGSVYEYFPGKDAIFATLKDQLDRETFEFVMLQLADVRNVEPTALLTAVLHARIEAATKRPRLEALLRHEIPQAVFRDQADASMERFSEAWRQFLAARPDAIRIRNVEAGLLLGPRVVELTVTHFADTDPERLKDPAIVQEITDMMTHWILKHPLDA